MSLNAVAKPWRRILSIEIKAAVVLPFHNDRNANYSKHFLYFDIHSLETQQAF